VKVAASQNLSDAINLGEPVTVGFYARALPMGDGPATGRISVRATDRFAMERISGPHGGCGRRLAMV
jgi:hypothetical protein